MELQTQLLQPSTPLCTIDEAAKERFEYCIHAVPFQAHPFVIEDDALQPPTNDRLVRGARK